MGSTTWAAWQRKVSVITLDVVHRRYGRTGAGHRKVAGRTAIVGDDVLLVGERDRGVGRA
jgi:hypothetical protein